MGVEEKKRNGILQIRGLTSPLAPLNGAGVRSVENKLTGA